MINTLEIDLIISSIFFKKIIFILLDNPPMIADHANEERSTEACSV